MQFHDQAFGGARLIILQCFEGGEGQGTKKQDPCDVGHCGQKRSHRL